MLSLSLSLFSFVCGEVSFFVLFHSFLSRTVLLFAIHRRYLLDVRRGWVVDAAVRCRVV